MTFKFPKEIKDLFGCFKDGSKRWEILESIINEDNKSSYTKIKKNLDFGDNEKGTFNYHLKELQKAGWLRNILEADSGSTRERSFYKITKFGLKAIEGAMQAMDTSTYEEDPLRKIRQEAFVDTGVLAGKTFAETFSIRIAAADIAERYLVTPKESDYMPLGTTARNLRNWAGDFIPDELALENPETENESLLITEKRRRQKL